MLVEQHRRAHASVSIGVLCALLAGAAGAQTVVSPDDRYGDRQQGHFGDTGQGYFGNPGVGHFTERRFPRDQEGRIPPSPAVPLRPRVTTPAPDQTAPYVVLPAPAEEAPPTR